MPSQDLLIPFLPRPQQVGTRPQEKLVVNQLDKRPSVHRDEKDRSDAEQQEEFTYVNALRERLKEEHSDPRQQQQQQPEQVAEGEQTVVGSAPSTEQPDKPAADLAAPKADDQDPASDQHLDLFV